MFGQSVVYRIKLRYWRPMSGPAVRNEEALTYDGAVARAKQMVAETAAYEGVKGLVCKIHREVLESSTVWQWPPAETAAPKEIPSE